MIGKRIKIRNLLIAALCLCVICVGGIFGVNGYVKWTAQSRILSAEQAAELKDVDCILVLGCLVKNSGVPSDMLEDRLRRGVELYDLGAAPKLLMTGDHGREDYDEVDAMKQYAVDHAVPSQDVFMDHAGFSTYESIYRAKEIFQAEKIIIVTQEYHLYRAIYVAQALGIDAYGVSSSYRNYLGQDAMDFRECLARIKDFGTSLLQLPPTYEGEVIPISGDGNLTNDDPDDFV